MNIPAYVQEVAAQNLKSAIDLGKELFGINCHTPTIAVDNGVSAVVWLYDRGHYVRGEDAFKNSDFFHKNRDSLFRFVEKTLQPTPTTNSGNNPNNGPYAA